MANGEQPKMVITVDIDTGKIDKVEKVIGVKPEGIELESQSEQPLTPEGGYQYIGTLLAYTGSNCVTLNVPGGGTYKVCS